MILTQYEITHMENRMLVNSEWPDSEDDFDEDEEFEDDEIDEF